MDGPNHKKNYCNSPIMINKNHTKYIKTPSFYYIAHFSKYIKPGAKRINLSTFTDNISGTAFENKDKSIVIVLFNKNNFYFLVFYLSVYLKNGVIFGYEKKSDHISDCYG